MTHAQYHHHVFETPDGYAAIGWSSLGIACFRLPAPNPHEAERALLRRLPASVRTEASGSVCKVVDASIRYFRGERIDFSSVIVDLGRQEPFALRIYEFVRRLGWGETTTYGMVARELGAEPQMARDVGQAMASNPVPLIIPCHRVLAAGGRIGGFSAPGGSLSKARMLEREGVAAGEPAGPAPQLGFGF